MPHQAGEEAPKPGKHRMWSNGEREDLAQRFYGTRRSPSLQTSPASLGGPQYSSHVSGTLARDDDHPLVLAMLGLYHLAQHRWSLLMVWRRAIRQSVKRNDTVESRST